MTAQVTITVSVAWWVRPYLAAVAFLARLTGREPDLDKVARVVQRGVRVRG